MAPLRHNRRRPSDHALRHTVCGRKMRMTIRRRLHRPDVGTVACGCDVATFATLLMALMPAAAAPMPAVKSAQCPPGHIVSGGFCAPLFRIPPAAVPKVMHCPNRLMQGGSSSCLEMRRR